MTANSLILGCEVTFPNAAPHQSESETMKKRYKYIKRCKEALWKRWKHEYLVALREKHNLKNKDKTFKINVGDVVRERIHVGMDEMYEIVHQVTYRFIGIDEMYKLVMDEMYEIV